MHVAQEAAGVAATLRRIASHVVESISDPSSSASCGGALRSSIVECHFDVCPRDQLAQLLDTDTACLVNAWDDTQWSVAVCSDAAQEIIHVAAALSSSASLPEQQGLELCLLLAGPANYGRWNRRKAALCMAECPRDRATRLIEELLVTALVLSKFHKISDVWQHRLWAWTRWCHSHATPCVDWPEKLRWALAQDAAVLRRAWEQHAMNYNAWHYLRQWAALMSEGLLFAPLSAEGRCNATQHRVDSAIAVFESLHATAVEYLRRHHADASCSVFIVHLVETAASLCTAAAEGLLPLVRRAWLSSLLLASKLLCQTCGVGHESLWAMRLGLVSIAISHPHIAAGRWSVGDELRFVDAHCNIADKVQVATDDIVFGDVNRAWVQCSGSVSWHNYYAARYGVLLGAALVKRRV